eukprot:5944983-Alexandrium_andersonii.AAC.1
MDGGTAKWEGGHMVQTTTHSMHKKYGMAKLFVEARIRRLQLLQRAVRHPDEHIQLFASVFGRMADGRE